MTTESKITVNDVACKFLRFAVTYYVKRGKPTNEVRTIDAALKVVTSMYGDAEASSFGPKSLKNCRSAMIAKGWCRTNINRQVERVKRMFKWAAGEELVPGSVYESLRCVTGLKFGRTAARESHRVGPVADNVVFATLRHMSTIVADMVRVQLLTGMRPCEACMLRPMDLDRSGKVWVYTPESHKTEHHGRRRTIFIGPEAQAVLRQYLQRKPEHHCFRPCDVDADRQKRMSRIFRAAWAADGSGRQNDHEPVKPKASRRARKRPPGEMYTCHSYVHAVHRAAKRAGVSKWSPNQLRHTFATKVRKSFGLEAAQVCLGHAKADVTQVYAERDLSLASRVARAVG